MHFYTTKRFRSAQKGKIKTQSFDSLISDNKNKQRPPWSDCNAKLFALCYPSDRLLHSEINVGHMPLVSIRSLRVYIKNIFTQ